MPITCTSPQLAPQRDCVRRNTLWPAGENPAPSQRSLTPDCVRSNAVWPAGGSPTCSAAPHPGGPRTTPLRHGFTLVELALVLAVIGVIIGAVSLSTSLTRTAGETRIFATFVQPWADAYMAYYRATGVVVGDNPLGPNGRVNSWTTDFVDPPPPLTGGRTTETCHTPVNALSGTDRTLANFMRCVGVSVPTGGGSGQEHQIAYTDAAGIAGAVSVAFVHSTFDPPGAGNITVQCDGERPRCNLMRLTGVSPSLARVIQSAADGAGDGTTGRFRCYNANHSGVATPILIPASPAETRSTAITCYWEMPV